MSVLEKVKAATAKLAPEEQFDLFRWWMESNIFKTRQLAALKKDIKIGLDQLDSGSYQTYTDTNIMQLADEISKKGRERLKKRSA